MSLSKSSISNCLVKRASFPLPAGPEQVPLPTEALRLGGHIQLELSHLRHPLTPPLPFSGEVWWVTPFSPPHPASCTPVVQAPCASPFHCSNSPIGSLGLLCLAHSLPGPRAIRRKPNSDHVVSLFIVTNNPFACSRSSRSPLANVLTHGVRWLTPVAFDFTGSSWGRV